MYAIRVEIEVTNIHIGALSPAGTAARNGIMKDRYGWPFIPASSFKGRLRHAIESLASGLNQATCQTHAKMCRNRKRVCPVCRVFGSPWIPGAVNFVDLEISGPAALADYYRDLKKRIQPPSTTERYGVGISRRRKVSEDQLLFTTELFQPGIPILFSGDLQGSVDLETAAWIDAGVRFLESIGSDRSRGLGWLDGRTLITDQAGNRVDATALKACLEALS